MIARNTKGRDDYNITRGRRSLATLKSDYVIYEPSHTYLQKKKQDQTGIR